MRSKNCRLRKHQKDEKIVKDKISRTKVLLEYIISKLKHFDRHLQLLNLQSNSTDSENHLPKIREIFNEAQHLLQLINDSESLD